MLPETGFREPAGIQPPPPCIALITDFSAYVIMAFQAANHEAAAVKVKQLGTLGVGPGCSGGRGLSPT